MAIRARKRRHANLTMTFLAVIFAAVAGAAPPQNKGGGKQAWGTEGAAVPIAWNDIAIEWIRQSERGPTISGRFAVFVNIALFDAWAAFENVTTGVFLDLDARRLSHLEPDQVPALRDYAMAHAAYTVINAIGETVLRQEYLEAGAGEIAAERLAAFQEQTRELLAATRAESLARLGRNRDAQDLLALAEQLAADVAAAALAAAATDGANQAGDYADTSAYQVSAWALPEPVPGTSDFDFLDGSYYFPGFNPAVADTVPNPGQAVVHPLVESGALRLTTTWQSLTQMGVFPPANDGGPQFPLTPHWGQVRTFTLASGSELRPASILTPYDDRGHLSADWVFEARQLVEFARRMQDAAPGGALQRARSEYWELGDATEYPPGWWLQRANQLAGDRGLSQREALKMTLTVSMAVFDAGVASWDTKFFFDSTRPITAVNELFYGSTVSDWRGEQTAFTDDRDHWRPYQLRRNLTPPFPDIVSGHSSFSTAASTVMRLLSGSNVLDFTTAPFISRFDLTDGFDGDPGTGNEEAILYWPLLSTAAEEAGLSRLYGGIHMMEGNLKGLTLGTTIGHRAVNLVDALFGDPAREVPLTIFGTGRANDDLRTPPTACGVVEIYGFHDPDRLMAAQACGGSAELYGGEALDTFVIDGKGAARIRDFEAGERVEISPARLTGRGRGRPRGMWIDGHMVSLAEVTDGAGYPVTRVVIDNTAVVDIDGSWTLGDINLSIR